MAAPQIADVTFKPLRRHGDQRGWLVEIYREDEMAETRHPVMAHISQTEPGVARGPHEHGVQTRTICGVSNPCAVSIPPGVVHAYRNVSDVPGWVFNGPNRLYAGPGKREPVDEIRHEHDAASPYQLDARASAT